jgi:DNA helicase-2/ATP-dependent DNA helicase PcrA
LSDDADVEEERRLAFVGMTRAKQELYLSHAKLREFRGQSIYTIPSMFLDELPPEVEHHDHSSGGKGVSAADEWRGGGRAAEQGWHDAGIAPIRRAETLAAAPTGPGYAEGMLVRHEQYGTGRVTEVSGYGALRKIKVRFAAGERAFIASMAKLEVVRKT